MYIAMDATLSLFLICWLAAWDAAWLTAERLTRRITRYILIVRGTTFKSAYIQIYVIFIYISYSIEARGVAHSASPLTP